MKNRVVSLSGGKDSTAMLLLLLEKGVDFHSVIFADTGWEFPEMYAHLDKLEQITGVPIVRLSPPRPFDYWLLERPVIGRKGENKGKIYRTGNGWPSPMRRWCTREKISVVNKYLDAIENPVSLVGIAADEAHRVKVNAKYPCEYPLIGWDITEADALEICQRHGFDWGGLYGVFKRVSCYCCPLQRIGDLRKLRRFYPKLWDDMLAKDREISQNIGFLGYRTVQDLEAQFAEEDRQLMLPI